ncbi:hypothetical protein DFP73DRAFT_194631 [Morchella snyderi]|nr:hypothetical protein DFP73DRAFT_194631 [Morchella snyderi]
MGAYGRMHFFSFHFSWGKDTGIFLGLLFLLSFFASFFLCFFPVTLLPSSSHHRHHISSLAIQGKFYRDLFLFSISDSCRYFLSYSLGLVRYCLLFCVDTAAAPVPALICLLASHYCWPIPVSYKEPPILRVLYSSIKYGYMRVHLSPEEQRCTGASCCLSNR